MRFGISSEADLGMPKQAAGLLLPDQALVANARACGNLTCAQIIGMCEGLTPRPGMPVGAWALGFGAGVGHGIGPWWLPHHPPASAGEVTAARWGIRVIVVDAVVVRAAGRKVGHIGIAAVLPGF